MPVLPPQGPQFLQNEASRVRIFRVSRREGAWELAYAGTENDARVWLCIRGSEAWPVFEVQVGETSHVQTAEEFMNT